jgi:hypothetical protein
VKKYSSIKIAVGFVLLVGIVYFGYQLIAARLVDSKHFPDIAPGKVTLLGIRPGLGYKIVVSNEIAQLVQGNSQLAAGDMSASDDVGEGDSSDKRRIPLKETLQSLQGNAEALGILITTMDDDLRKAKENIPPQPVIWNAEDVQKALDGDKALTDKLEHDMNVKLDGTPTDYITRNGLYKGIVLRIPVPVKVRVGATDTVLTGHVLMPYRASFTKRVEKALQEKGGLSPSDEMIKGYYLEEVTNLKDKPGNREKISDVLKQNISSDTVQEYAEAAERVLAHSQVVLNDSHVDGSTMDQFEGPRGKPIYNLNLSLTEEGRERLWQYSRHNVGNQLLLICNGIAIAAPTIRHELAQSTITVTQMSDPGLVQEAMDVINSKSKSASRQP